ncbi:unnamed protein product [Adineta steineri]|uniref:Uncharacterized protein n=1 Tax=Adineta steineri TaxID=433720 RepID=A0A813WH36_9BILA|nr:unnamed protein product [Adineta steineri]CAF3580110.1 unnamed protein product [Adineta steineri]
MSRYHYSRNAPNSATSRSDTFTPRHYASSQSLKPTVSTATTTSNIHNHNTNHINQNSHGSFTSTFIPLVRSSRAATSDKRGFIHIPVKRDDGITLTNNHHHHNNNNNNVRSVPVTFINETSSLLTNSNDLGGDTSPPPRYASLLRPTPKYFHRRSSNNHNINDESIENMPRLPTVSRRLNLTIPVMTTTTADDDDDAMRHNNVSSLPVRPIPIRLSQSSNTASIPTNTSRLSNTILRSSSQSNNSLLRQKSDLINTSSSDLTHLPPNTPPTRRAEAMAREAIQGIARFQQQQQQRRGSLLSENGSDLSGRSPVLSRRVIINLKNNQSVSLDSRISSANSLSTKPPVAPSSSRITQRNNVYHIPVLHEIQVPPHPATIAAESFLHFPRSPSTSNLNTNSYKNEFRMEIPVTVITNSDQENYMQGNYRRSSDGLMDYDPNITIMSERTPSASSTQTLKSILKRSASRDSVLRKNVSFMNA